MRLDMGQEEVLKLLKRKKGLMSAIEIAKVLKCTQASLNKQLNQLIKYRQVEKKTRKIRCGTQSYKRDVNHFKYKKKRKRSK